MSTAFAAAQTAATSVLEGTVRDRQTRQLIASATVLIENSALATVTDADGRFRLTEVPVGTHILRVEAAGYVVLSQADVLVSPGRASVFDIEVDRGVGGISEQVEVRAPAFDRPPDVTTSNYGMQYAEVRRSAGNAERSPSYQRLDLRFDRRVSLGRTYTTFFFEAQNVYNRENVYRYVWNP